MATMSETITVNVRVRVNDVDVSLWRVKVLGSVARLLRVPLIVDTSTLSR